MAQAEFDVLGIGNAIVDILASTEDDFLVREGLSKGTMHLIDAERADTLYAHMGPAIEASGGSAGNTTAGVASLGGARRLHRQGRRRCLRRHLPPRHAGDRRAFRHRAADRGAPTARSMILITPDGERTMNTYLGACQALGPADIDADVVGRAAITYLEGYLWDPPEAKKAFVRAAEIAHAAGRKVSLSLSDAFCVDRFRAEFLDLIRSKTVDILLANDSEVRSLYETADSTRRSRR